MPKRIETPVDICNLALLLLNQLFINALEDDASIQAKACNLVYENCRTSLLEKYIWNFAIKCRPLKNIQNDDDGIINTKGMPFKYVYLLPNDFIRLIDVVTEQGNQLLPPYSNNTKDPYLFANRRIYCGVAPGPDVDNLRDTVFAKYIYDFTNVTLMPGYFKEVLVLEIALKLTNYFEDSKPLISMVSGLLEQRFDEAKRIDAQQAVIRSMEYIVSDLI
jgi:hypothetical protein